MLIETYPEPLPQPRCARPSTGWSDGGSSGRSTSASVLATPADMLVVRDFGMDRTFNGDRYEVRSLPSAKLLEHAGLGEPRRGAAFIQQFRRWLDAVAASWISVPVAGSSRVIMPDVLGHLVNVDLEEYDELLGMGDAA